MSSKKKSPKRPSPPEKNKPVPDAEIRNLFLIILAGVILRFIFYFEIKDTPLFYGLYSDSKIFSDLAQDIIKNNRWFGSIVFYMSPGYTYFLAIIYSLFGNDPALIRIIQILINSATIYIIYLLAKKLFSIRTAYIAAILSTLYSVFIFYSSLLLLEILFTFFISLFLLFLIRTNDAGSSRHWLFTGLFLGIAALFRGNILLFFPVVLLWIYFENRKAGRLKLSFSRMLFFTAGVLAAVLPVTLNNFAAGREIVLLTTNYGINLYIGNHEDATGIYKIPEDIDLSLDPAGRKYAERMTGRDMSETEVSGFWSGKAIHFIKSDPVEALGITVKKFFLFIDDQESPQSFMMDSGFYAKNYSTLLKLPLPGFYFIFLFAAAGILLSFKKDKNLILLYLFLTVYIISIIIFFVVGRFRIGITPVLIIFAAFGILKIYDIIRSGEFRRLIIPGAVIVILTAVNITFIPAYSFSDYDAYLNLGNSSFEKQQYDEALEYYRKSLELKEESGTYVLIGNTLSVKKDRRGAFEAYKKAIEMNPGNPLAHFNLGTLFVESGDYARAAEAFNAAIKTDSSFAEAYRNIAILYYMQEKYEESLLFFEKYLYLAKDDQVKETVRADIEEIKKRLR